MKLTSLKRMAASALAWVVALWLIGAGFVVSGVALLTGPGWAFVASGAFLMAAAVYITKGLKPNG